MHKLLRSRPCYWCVDKFRVTFIALVIPFNWIDVERAFTIFIEWTAKSCFCRCKTAFLKSKWLLDCLRYFSTGVLCLNWSHSMARTIWKAEWAIILKCCFWSCVATIQRCIVCFLNIYRRLILLLSTLWVYFECFCQANKIRKPKGGIS